MKAEDWIKVCRDKWGFLADRMMEQMYESLPIIIWEEAVERYLKWYFRKYKCRNRHHTNNLAETSRWWGKFMVVDSKGYSRYFM